MNRYSPKRNYERLGCLIYDLSQRDIVQSIFYSCDCSRNWIAMQCFKNSIKLLCDGKKEKK